MLKENLIFLGDDRVFLMIPLFLWTPHNVVWRCSTTFPFDFSPVLHLTLYCTHWIVHLFNEYIYIYIWLTKTLEQNGIIFVSIPESHGETNELCEATLIDLMKSYMKLGQMIDIVFQPVHRLGRRQAGTANSDAKKLRPTGHMVKRLKDIKCVLKSRNA